MLVLDGSLVSLSFVASYFASCNAASSGVMCLGASS
jgi:hypothetical protein